MTGLDWSVLGIYLAGIVGLSFFLARNQHSPADYFLGGRNLSSWAIAGSIMATQVSAVSLIGAPAFVAVRTGGGLRWLQYEFAVPLAMIGLIFGFVPVFHRLGIFTIYEYVQRRFGPVARMALSLIFLISRGLGTGVGLYAASVVLAVCLDMPLAEMLLLVGAITVLYTTVGGIKADIYSDVLQLIILALGTIAGIVSVSVLIADVGAATEAISPARLQTVDFRHHGLGDGETFSFWPMVIGGFFLYLSYYGCDQSQAQRLLTSETVKESQRALFLNGLLRFPLVLLYCFFGVLLAAFLTHEPGFAERIPDEHPDYLVPLFMIEYLPPGITGLMMAGIFAAAMSSLDSAFNSMSAVTMRDFLGRGEQLTHLTERQSLKWSRLCTVVWGVFCTASGFWASRMEATVIELINMIGSAFYGPTLAVFLLGLWTKRTTQRGAIAGLAGGVGVNLMLWVFVPSVSWLWWNAIGCFVALATGYVVSLLFATQANGLRSSQVAAENEMRQRSLSDHTVNRWGLLLLLAFVGMVIISALMELIAIAEVVQE
jgi:SSS family solute:Na+ symporter